MDPEVPEVAERGDVGKRHDEKHPERGRPAAPGPR